MLKIRNQCMLCIERWGQMPSPWGDSVLELDAYREHATSHVQDEEEE